MYCVVLHPSAEKELEIAAIYYENCSEGLGEDFLADFDRNKLYWATGGKLFSGRLNANGLFAEKELQDFTQMKFEAIQAPY